MLACALVVWSLALADGVAPDAPVFRPAPPAVPLPAPPAAPPSSPSPPPTPIAAPAIPSAPAQLEPVRPVPPARRIFEAPHPLEPSAPPSFAAQLSWISKRWYGWQLVLSDAAFLALGSISPHGPTTIAATVGMTAGAPAFHFANGDAGIGTASLLVRGALMSAAIAAGQHWAPEKDQCGNVNDCGSQISIDVPKLLVAVAGVVFLALDDTVLSRRGDSVAATSAPSAGRATAAILVPTLAPRPGGGTAGLVAIF